MANRVFQWQLCRCNGGFFQKAFDGRCHIDGQYHRKYFARARKKQFYGRVKVTPVRKIGSTYERAISFTLTVSVEQAPIVPPSASDRGGPFTFNSVLNTGDIFKFGVSGTGIYKLDYSYLKNDLGISNIDNIDPRTIRIYGNGGAMLPERNSDARPDDLLENAIVVVGENDGKFDAGDYILFYAVGPRPWQYRPSNTDPEFTTRVNLYDHHAWYFLKTNGGTGLRMAEQPSVAASYITEEFDDFGRIEDEKQTC